MDIHAPGSASNGMRFGGEMKKLWSFEDKRAKLSENFATETPFGRVFSSCETTFGTRVPFAAQFPSFWSCDMAAKSPLSCEITFEQWNGYEMSREINFGLRNHFWASEWLRKCSKLQKWSVNMPLFCEMISKLRNGCEITSKLRNGLQIAKLTCEMEGDLQKHFAKPREVAKMPIEPYNHASKEESPLTEITHEVSHSISYLLKTIKAHSSNWELQLRRLCYPRRLPE